MGKVKKFDRNKRVGPMTDFVRVQNPENAEAMGIQAMFENNRYGAIIKHATFEGFGTPGPDGSTMPMEGIHLIIVRHDKKKIEIPWEEKQQIKSYLFGGTCEAMEIFPSEMRKMTSIPDHHTHMWVFPPMAYIPLGLYPSALADFAKEDSLDKFTVTSDELNVYLVEDDGVLQVFGTEDEARENYKKAGADMPDGKIGKIGDVPTEDAGAAWTAKAKAKVANVLAKADRLDKLMNEGDYGNDAVVVDTNGPKTDQDELEDENGIGEYAPNSDEENVMAGEYMAMGVDQIRTSREASVADAVSKLSERADNPAKEDSVDEVTEADAAVDLAAIREQVLKDK